jgi:hypothetical protein
MKDSQQVRVLFEEGQVNPRQPLNYLGVATRCVCLPMSVAEKLAGTRRHDRLDQIVFVREVAVQGALCDAREAGQVFDPGLVQSLFSE